MDAQQNVFNVGFDLATILAIAGVGQGGDLLETKKLSIGCDASSRTSGIIGGLLGDELGLNGHNHFESDTSLTRNDYYLSPTRDNYSFNSTLFTSMMAACDGECDRSKLSVYRKQRYEESKRDNGQFFFGKTFHFNKEQLTYPHTSCRPHPNRALRCSSLRLRPLRHRPHSLRIHHNVLLRCHQNLNRLLHPHLRRTHSTTLDQPPQPLR